MKFRECLVKIVAWAFIFLMFYDRFPGTKKPNFSELFEVKK
jgi:hypothetical protein